MTQQKSILHVIKLYYPSIGGMETVARQLAEASVQKGNRVSVLCCGDKNEITDINGVTVYRVRPFFNVGSAPISFRYIFKLWELMGQVDIVHFHVPNPIGELAFCLARNRGKVKTLCTYHLDPVRPKSFVKIYKELLHSFLRQCGVICPTSENYVHSSEILQAHQDKCAPIPLGVDIKRFSEVKPTFLTEVERLISHLKHPRVLFCGRFSFYNGLHVLIEAMREVPDASLILVGSGEKEMELRQQVKDLGMEDRTAFLGFLANEIYAVIYHVADLFVLPSIYRSEAFGIVGLEAMAAGLPLVTTELGTGTSCYNINGETGFVVPPMDVRAMAEAIRMIIHNSDLSREMSENVRRRAGEFSLEKMQERYDGIFQNL